MARSIRQVGNIWRAHVWDEKAARENGKYCDGAAMRSGSFSTEREALEWVTAHEVGVITRYRARKAYEAGAPCVKPDWLPYYRIWTEDDQILREQDEKNG